MTRARSGVRPNGEKAQDTVTVLVVVDAIAVTLVGGFGTLEAAEVSGDTNMVLQASATDTVAISTASHVHALW